MSLSAIIYDDSDKNARSLRMRLRNEARTRDEGSVIWVSSNSLSFVITPLLYVISKSTLK